MAPCQQVLRPRTATDKLLVANSTSCLDIRQISRTRLQFEVLQ